MVTGLTHGIMVPLSQSLYCAGLVPVHPLAPEPTKAAWELHYAPTNCFSGSYAGKDDVDADQTSRSRNLHLRRRLPGAAFSTNRSPRSTILRQTRSLDRPRPSYSGIGSGSSPSQRYCTLTPALTSGRRCSEQVFHLTSTSISRIRHAGVRCRGSAVEEPTQGPVDASSTTDVSNLRHPM